MTKKQISLTSVSVAGIAYWCDPNDNKWAKGTYSEEEALERAGHMTSCHGCVSCSDCFNCFRCENCSECRNCHRCLNCQECRGLDMCEDCTNCEHCVHCVQCGYCAFCTGCFTCRNIKMPGGDGVCTGLHNFEGLTSNAFVYIKTDYATSVVLSRECQVIQGQDYSSRIYKEMNQIILAAAYALSKVAQLVESRQPVK